MSETNYFQVRSVDNPQANGCVVRAKVSTQRISLSIIAGETTIDELNYNWIHGFKIGGRFIFEEIKPSTARKLKADYQDHRGAQAMTGYR